MDRHQAFERSQESQKNKKEKRKRDPTEREAGGKSNKPSLGTQGRELADVIDGRGCCIVCPVESSIVHCVAFIVESSSSTTVAAPTATIPSPISRFQKLVYAYRLVQKHTEKKRRLNHKVVKCRKGI